VAKSIFELDEFKPYAARWQARQRTFKERKSYFDGSIYAGTKGPLGMLGSRLDGSIRPLYLPLARAVHLDAGIVPAGWRLAESAAGFAAAVGTVFEWSDWHTCGMLFVRYGAEFGSVGLKVSDLRDKKRVMVRPISPEVFMLVGADDYDRSAALALCIEARSDASGTFEYAEVISPKDIRTFKDGALFGFGGRPARYDNALGFVPLVESAHLDGGGEIGECTFQDVMPMLDEVNRTASDLAEMIGRDTDPQFYVTGVDDGALKRGDNVWYLPDPTAKAGAVVAPVDIAGILKFIQEIANNVHARLPELAFDDLRSKQQIATATVELQLMELVVKIGLVRPNYDHALADALRMCGRAARTMSQSPNEPMSQIAGLDSDALTFARDREVIPIDPETKARIAKLEAEAAAAAALATPALAGGARENSGVVPNSPSQA
jgi:hypothetical protein